MTGNTSESLDLDDDDFNWTEFYREQWADTVTEDSINKFKADYQNSDEEKRDLLAAYTQFKGRLDSVFETVMLSNPLDDEERFRIIIDKAIADGEVKSYDAYAKESAGSKEKRRKIARKEAKEAEEYAKELGVHDKLFGTGATKGAKKGKGKGKGDDEAALAALIQQRSKGRAANFLDDLEAKYVGGGKGKKRKEEEPPEEAFQKTAARHKKRKSTVLDDDEVEDDEEDEQKVTKGKKKKSNKSKA